ncbi:MAG: YajQ family cyclic di-GMP-binding protein [Bdellovibrionota bacterium]|nr:YajQ family cyclic di-GMP-binding protein [Bdellovibrionota bacterium]
MPSFDLVSKLDMGELKNVINQTERQIAGRYDFKGADVRVELKEEIVELWAPDEYKINAVLDILRTNMVKRSIGMNALEPEEPVPTGRNMLKQILQIKKGIDKEKGKQINKLIKNSGHKVTSAYVEEKIRITGKKIDDLQAIFGMLKGHKDVKLELQMENMKK